MLPPRLRALAVPPDLSQDVYEVVLAIGGIIEYLTVSPERNQAGQDEWEERSHALSTPGTVTRPERMGRNHHTEKRAGPRTNVAAASDLSHTEL